MGINRTTDVFERSEFKEWTPSFEFRRRLAPTTVFRRCDKPMGDRLSYLSP
jgi:hypothetical protein